MYQNFSFFSFSFHFSFAGAASCCGQSTSRHALTFVDQQCSTQVKSLMAHNIFFPHFRCYGCVLKNVYIIYQSPEKKNMITVAVGLADETFFTANLLWIF
jgi:hypothetical protein